MNIAILGCGNWGSVFGIIQHRNGHAVKIWEFDRERCEKVKRTRDNSPFLTSCTIPQKIQLHWDIAVVLEESDLVVIAVPSQALATVSKAVVRAKMGCTCVLNLTKGIDVNSLKRPSEVIQAITGKQVAVYTLSGPCIANEIIRGAPTAGVIVGDDDKGLANLQQALTTETFRIYRVRDIIGVELGAATKNVIALGCGISDGLGYGTNAKGALITRGIVEIQRLGVHMGAQPKTFWGLSGLGDLVTTSFSTESRNHRFGVCVGQGQTMETVLKNMIMVAEGVPTAQAIQKLKMRYGIEMPICDSVYSILYHNTSPQQAIQELMMRPLTHE